ncbi:hypothetical protein ABZ726_04495, partial [Streptomyces hundungensis]
MRTLTRRLLLPGLTALALAGTGCSAPPPTAATGPGSAATPSSAADGTQQLEVNAAPQGSAAPTPLARTRTGAGQPEKSSLKVASYDRASGRAVIAAAPQGHTAKPSHSPAPGKPLDKPVAVGDVIASAPAPGAPDGLLAKVTEVAEFVRNLRGTDSEIDYGNLLTVPLGGGFL